jgi:hypothetical protein
MGMPDCLQPPNAGWVRSHGWGGHGASVVTTPQTDWHNPCFSGMFLILVVPEKPSRIGQRRRRIWLIDCQASSIGLELRDDLGDWIRRRLTKGVEGHAIKAKDMLAECNVPMEELRSQWHLQKASQLSVRARMSEHCTAYLIFSL